MDETPNPDAVTAFARALAASVDAEIEEMRTIDFTAFDATRPTARGRTHITDHVDALGQRIHTMVDANSRVVMAWPVTEFGVRKGTMR